MRIFGTVSAFAVLLACIAALCYLIYLEPGSSSPQKKTERCYRYPSATKHSRAASDIGEQVRCDGCQRAQNADVRGQNNPRAF
jgi:hypothetical protein